MFYCDDCRKKNQWPEGLAKSVGPCEVCGTRALCSDWPSKYLRPIAPPLQPPGNGEQTEAA